MALLEIHKQLAQFQQIASPKIVEAVEVNGLTDSEVDQTIIKFGRKPKPEDGEIPANKVIFRQRSGYGPLSREELIEFLGKPQNHPHQFRSLYGDSETRFLQVEKRAEITSAKQFGDLQMPDPFNSYQMMSVDDDLRARIRDILYRAFRKYIALDPTTSQFRLIFASRPPANRYEEQGFYKEAREYYATAELLDSFSVGIRAYVGLIVEVAAANARVVLIDEPEAFLHPPLAQQLGVEIGSLASETQASVFIATHSAHFLMGCLHAGVSADIVRLTYQDGKATARRLPNDDLFRLMRNPLLRSAGVLNALFYEYVVVAESDADRAFYQEINERLVKVGRGIRNCLFLNAQNKQTTRVITKPLRGLGIPTVAIVDIDILKEGGTVWGDFLEAAAMPEIDRKTLATTRDILHAKVSKDSLNLKRDGGLAALNPPERETASNLFARMAEYGLFVVEGGELESWLKHLGATGHSPSWLIQMFQMLGEDSSLASYVSPAEGDVWRFIDRIASWFHNQLRKGMPA